MFKNPEFQRYLWTRFSKARVVSLLVIYGLFALLLAMMPGDWQSDFIKPFHNIAFLSIGIWGVYNASNVFGREVANKTWDFQKMSPMSSWALVWGKLFGATSFAWFVAMVCYATVLVALVGREGGVDTYALFHHTVLFFLAGALAQGCALLISLIGNEEKAKKGSILALIIGLVVVTAVGGFSTGIFGGIENLGLTRPNANVRDVLPYGVLIDDMTRGYMHVLFATFWVFVGAHQIMREKLKYNDPPFVWLGFVVAMSLYIAGLYASSNAGISSLVYFTALTLTYFTMLRESGDITKYNSWFYYVRAKDRKKIIEKTPNWAASSVVVLASLIVASAFIKSGDNINGSLFLVVFTLFALRDGLVIHALRLGQKAKGSYYGILVYYLLVYVMLPWLLANILGFESAFNHFSPINIADTAHQQGLNSLSLFFPIPIQSSLWMVTPVLVETLLAGLFLLKRLKTMQAQPQATQREVK